THARRWKPWRRKPPVCKSWIITSPLRKPWLVFPSRTSIRRNPARCWPGNGHTRNRCLGCFNTFRTRICGTGSCGPAAKSTPPSHPIHPTFASGTSCARERWKLKAWRSYGTRTSWSARSRRKLRWSPSTTRPCRRSRAPCSPANSANGSQPVIHSASSGMIGTAADITVCGRAKRGRTSPPSPPHTEGAVTRTPPGSRSRCRRATLRLPTSSGRSGKHLVINPAQLNHRLGRGAPTGRPDEGHRVIPLHDDNPTQITPVMTIASIVACTLVFLYLTCGVIAALSHALTDPASTVPMVGASGAISGVLGAYLVLFPRAQVLVLIPLGLFTRMMYVPAGLVLGFWFVMQLLSGGLSLGRQGGGVAFFAHVGGFVAGMALIGLFKRPDVHFFAPRRHASWRNFEW